MKKIGVATVYTGYNYGSSLQAYATTKIVSKLGMKPVVLKLQGSIIAGRDVRLKKLIIIICRSLLYTGSIKSRKNYRKSIAKKLSNTTLALFDSFTKNQLCPLETTYSKLKKISRNDDYAAFVCGSDQVWNSSSFYVDPFYYLQFAPINKRIAFAPSFGKDFVPDYNKKIMSHYISEIPYKSVREKSGIEIIKELTGLDSQILIDPTLALTAEEWRNNLSISKCAKIENRYLLAYFLDKPSKLAIQTINQISHQYNLKVIGLPYEFDDLPWDVVSAGPKEFVEYINDASFVCTDSFHGTAFSLNFNIPFYTFKRNYDEGAKQSTRIESLLSMVDALDRLEPQSCKNAMALKFDNINRVLLKEKNVSYNYLKNILNSKQ